MRLCVVTDAWFPQPNGVVRVLSSLVDRLRVRGYDIEVIAPDRFHSVPCPTYPEIRLAIAARRKCWRMIEAFAPDAIHIATEGPLGQAARRWCLVNERPFTTAYHTKFPEYIHARVPLPLSWLYAQVRKFHAPSSTVMVPSHSVYDELRAHDFANVRPWAHGVDTDIFHPQPKNLFADLPRPLFMYVGRVTVEKNLPAFLDLDLPGSKVVVGSGPMRETLMKRYRHIGFHIANGDAELSRFFAQGDAFVFPSLTDTFGLVMLEALASGVPVAAFPVTGPLDVIGNSGVGVLDNDLRAAALAALEINPAACRAYAETFSWETVCEQFLGYLAPFNSGRDAV